MVDERLVSAMPYARRRWLETNVGRCRRHRPAWRLMRSKSEGTDSRRSAWSSKERTQAGEPKTRNPGIPKTRKPETSVGALGGDRLAPIFKDFGGEIGGQGSANPPPSGPCQLRATTSVRQQEGKRKRAASSEAARMVDDCLVSAMPYARRRLNRSATPARASAPVAGSGTPVAGIHSFVFGFEPVVAPRSAPVRVILRTVERAASVLVGS